MAFNKRPDGTLIRNLHSFRGMLPFLMRNRTESIIYFEQEIDVTETLAYVKKHNQSINDRLSEGIYCARAIDMIKKFVEHPAELSEIPEIPEEILDELNLNPIKSLKEDGYV